MLTRKILTEAITGGATKTGGASMIAKKSPAEIAKPRSNESFRAAAQPTFARAVNRNSFFIAFILDWSARPSRACIASPRGYALKALRFLSMLKEIEAFL